MNIDKLSKKELANILLYSTDLIECKCDWINLIKKKSKIHKIICNKCNFSKENKHIFVSNKKYDKDYYIECPNCKNRIYKQQLIIICDNCNKKKIENYDILPDITKTKRR
jgi:SHS2 domain-containing protein